MKSVFFVIIGLIGFSCFAETRGLRSEIKSPDIVCSSTSDDLQVLINTASGRIWYKEVSSNARVAAEVEGAVYSGVSTPQRFEGEILGEGLFAGADSYFTLIFRRVNDSAQLEFLVYPKQDQKRVLRYLFSSCELR